MLPLPTASCPPNAGRASLAEGHTGLQNDEVLALRDKMGAPGYTSTAELELKCKQAPLPKRSVTPICDAALTSANEPCAATQFRSPGDGNKVSHWCSKALKFSKYIKSNIPLNTPNFILFQQFSSCQTLPGQPSTGNRGPHHPGASSCQGYALLEGARAGRRDAGRGLPCDWRDTGQGLP